MWVLPGMAAIVAAESRRQWKSLSMERRRMLTTPAKKAAGRRKRSWVEVVDKVPGLVV